MVKTTTIAIAIVVIAIIAVGAYYVTLPAPTATPTATATATATPTAVPETEIKIGVIVSLTGSESFPGVKSLEGIKMAVEEINAKGGINGKLINLIYYDDAGDPTQTVALCRRLITSDKVPVGILAVGSETAMAGVPIFQDARIPVLVPWAGHPDVTKNNYAFRIGPTAYLEGLAMADFAVNKLDPPVKKAAVIHSGDDPWELTICTDAVPKYLAKFGNGASVVYDKTIEPTEVEFTPMLTEMKNLGVDTIFVAFDIPQAGPLMKQSAAIGYTSLRMVESDSFDTEEVIAASGQMDRHYGVVLVDKWDPTIATWIDAYTKKWGSGPLGFASGFCYDAVGVLAQVIGQVGTDSQAIYNGLEGVKNYKGAGGMIGAWETPQHEVARTIAFGVLHNNEINLANRVDLSKVPKP